jgi:hypothetical protein
MSNAGIGDDGSEYETLDHKVPPRAPLFAFLSSFPFLLWGLGWWEGFYNHPEGNCGFLLACIAVISGVILCAVGVNGMLDWTLRF